MVLRGEYDRRSGHASLVSSTFTFQQSQRLFTQAPRGNSSYRTVHENRCIESRICTYACMRGSSHAGQNSPIHSPKIHLSPLSSPPYFSGGYLYEKKTGRPGSDAGAMAPCQFATRRTS